MSNDMNVVVIIIGVIIVAVIPIAVLFIRGSRLNDELDQIEGRLLGSEDQVRQLQAKIRAVEAEKAQIAADKAQSDKYLNTSEHHRKRAEDELKVRPRVERKVYRILTVGMKATGKSSLTLKWANPLVDLGTIEGTKMERYERLVSLSEGKESLTQHIFEVYDWGGEHIVDAQEQLVTGEINGILMVVDLGGRDARQVEPERIQEQLAEFNPHTLKYFLTPTIVTSCKTIVLFINKSDLISNSPAQAEAQARHYYAPLIESLQRHATNIDVKVMVGSASFGHSTHVLFSHFVEQVLPQTAYDRHLLQRIKSGTPPRRTQTQTPGIHGGVQLLPEHLNPPAPSKPPVQAPPAPHNARMAPPTQPAPPAPPPPARNFQTSKIPPMNADDSTHSMETTVPYQHLKRAKA